MLSQYLCHFSTEMAEIWTPGTFFEDVRTKEFICRYRSLRVVVIVLVFSELADNKNVWVLVMYFPKLEFATMVFSILDPGLPLQSV